MAKQGATPIIVVAQLHNPHTIDPEIESVNSYHSCYSTGKSCQTMPGTIFCQLLSWLLLNDY